MREQDPDIILIEQTLPGNGLRLAEMIAMNPAFRHIPIILTSVTPSLEAILHARNAGVATYLAKPFRPSELRERIEAVLMPADPEKSTAQTDIRNDTAPSEPQETPRKAIKERIRTIEGLPPFPSTHAQILELANSENTSSEDIAEHIQMDPGLLATVFKIVNSSAYGFQKKVDSLKLAVTLLGLEEIANLVMTAQVFKSLGNYDAGSGLDRAGIWQHSVGTAFITRAIAKRLQTEVESAFLAGMLHDLGKIVLDRCFTDYYRAVIDLIKEKDMWILDAERQILGLTHADVGAQLAIEWRFSEKYLYSIANHHAPSHASRYVRLVSLVHLADIICRQLAFGSGGDASVPDFDEEVLGRFSLGERGINILLEAGKSELENAQAFLTAMATD